VPSPPHKSSSFLLLIIPLYTPYSLRLLWVNNGLLIQTILAILAYCLLAVNAVICGAILLEANTR